MKKTTFSDIGEQIQHENKTAQEEKEDEEKAKKFSAIFSERMRQKLLGWKTFANETTAHGLKNVTSGSKCRRMIWLVAVLSACGFLLYNLFTILIDYSNHPFSTVFQISPKSKLVFPAVTICNLNKFDANKYAYSEELTLIQRIIAGGPFKPNLTLDDIKDKHPYDKIFAQNYWDMAHEVAHTIEETFTYCSWFDEPINCLDHISYIFTPIGRCFQFNHNASVARTSLRPGSKGGFSAIMKVNPEGYTQSEYDAAGMRVLLHDQHDYPDVFSRGILFSPGFTYYVSFFVKSFKFLPYPYKAFGDGYCSAEDAVDYSPDETQYSMKSCIYHKASDITSQKCGCKEKNCTVFEYFSCYKPLFEEYYENTTTTNNIFSCAYACHLVLFDPIVSAAAFPSTTAAPVVSDRVNISQSDLTKSLVQINLFYEDFLVRESFHVATYGDWFSILAMLGGNMGIFLGASLLTFGEFLELVFRSCLSIKDKVTASCRPKSKRNSIVNVAPKKEADLQAF